ncbi:MAG TPA: hypothetical protein VLC09_17370 [Polyangiaceae bacterium]|nr:hypothetical protein [Polyangiaceae bacterium]
MRNITSFVLVCSLVGSFALVGCSEAERTYDCAQICDNYATCLDSNLDKTDCVDQCEDKGEADPDFAAKASECEECLDDKDCASATLNCATKCAEVVAESALGQGGSQD